MKSLVAETILKKGLILLSLLLPLAILAPGWSGFAYAPSSNYSDAAISHYPNAAFLVNSLRHGEFPLWSPAILGGYPFAADPLSELWYLPAWLAYALPLPFGFNLVILLHLWWSGIGMWRFLRGLGLADFPSLAGALAWELLPKTLAHFGAGHITLVYALSWTPWLLLVETRYSKTKYSFLVGMVLGWICLADVRWAAYAGITWLAYSSWRWLSMAAGQNLRQNLWRQGRHLLETLVIAGLIAGPQLIPLLEFTQNSTRTAMTITDNLDLSLSPLNLLGLIAPSFQGYAEWMVYSGGFAIIALLWSLFQADLRRKTGFWLVVLTASLLLALGSAFPPNQWIFRLPGWDLLRVPARFMIVFGFSISVILAMFLNVNGKEDRAGSHFWPNLASAGIAGFAWVIGIGLWITTGAVPWSFLWGALFLVISVMVIAVRNRGWMPQTIYQIVGIGILVLDLAGVAQSEFTYRPVEQVLKEGAGAAEWIRSQPGDFRTYSPSYNIPQQTAMNLGLETVDGIDPLQISWFVRFMVKASGIPIQRYSVTMPPFEKGDPSTDNRYYQPDLEALGRLNVGYVISKYTLRGDHLTLVRQVDGEYIYRNQAARPKAWVEDSANSEIAPVRDLQRSANQISLTATGPGKVVFAEVDYLGWKAWVDGKPAEIIRAESLLRSVPINAGSHSVVIEFQPASLYLGWACAIIAWAWCAFQWRRAGR